VLPHLLADGKIERVQIVEKGEPLKGEWYLHQEDVPLLEQIQAGQWQPRTTILSPFDNLICDRDRTELLWDFYYRIEIYVPKTKREYGYYVLPILHNDKLIGRIDAKMDRKKHTLQLNNIYAEAKAAHNVQAVKAIRKAIEQMAEFLQATKIEWGNVPEVWAKLKD
jgi:uncharacterized protein YcaQ